MVGLADILTAPGWATAELRLRAEPDELVDLRGLIAQHGDVVSDLRPFTFEVLGVAAIAVDLEPGGETLVAVTVPGLPRNADVKRVAATLRVSPGTAGTTAETTAVRVTSGGAAQSFAVAVDPPPLPRNVRVGLAGGEAFWSHAGALQEDDYPLGDFAEALNRYLDAARLPDGPTTLSFTVRSDTPGRVSILVDPEQLEYTLLQTQAWPNAVDGSVRIDRTLELDFGTVLWLPLDPLAGTTGRPLPLAGVRLDVSGAPGPERLLGDVPGHDGHQFASVSPDYAVAHRFAIAGGGAGLGFPAGSLVPVAGVAAILEADADAELYVELQPDVGGAPGGGEPLGGAAFPVAPRTGTGAAWVYAALPAPVEVPVDAPHWIVLRSIQGVARLAIAGGAAAEPGGLLVNRGGRLWKPVVRGSAVALARVVFLPQPDTEVAPLALGLAGGPVQRPEVTAQTRRLTLDATAAPVPATLVVTSHCRGSVSLANVVQEFGR